MHNLNNPAQQFPTASKPGGQNVRSEEVQDLEMESSQ